MSIAAACAPFGDVGRPGTQHEDDRLEWKVTNYVEIGGWSAPEHMRGFHSFRVSCGALAGRSGSDPFGGVVSYGTVGDWGLACQAALQLDIASDDQARLFFETWFTPVQVLNGDEPVGLFTGYYEPELRGRRRSGNGYNTPLYSRPADLLQVDLGGFRPTLKGERIAGRVEGSKLVPYATRAQIVASGLGSNSKPLLFVDSAVDAFFLEVQGSGRVVLDTGETVRVAFDGQNGHPYTSIGRVLIERGEIERGKLSMQKIRSWIAGNPGRAAELMNENASYVFFKEMPIADPSVGADGAQGVPLTSEGSVAVDLKFHALGAPVWIDVKAPAEDSSKEDEALQKLFVMQDTGGAIRGPVRADIYWGTGVRAESIAGRMAHKGRMYVLLPKPVAARLN